MQKIVLKVELHDDKIKQRAMKAVSGIQGVESVAVDMKENKMTVVGGIDPVMVVGKLRKLSHLHADILLVGPAKEEEKKKKEEPKKEEEKKTEPVCVCHPIYYNPPYPYYYVTPVEQNPIGCVIL